MSEKLFFSQDLINAWCDENEVEVKQVGHVVGAIQGKHGHEDSVIAMVWY